MAEEPHERWKKFANKGNSRNSRGQKRKIPQGAKKLVKSQKIRARWEDGEYYDAIVVKPDRNQPTIRWNIDGSVQKIRRSQISTQGAKVINEDQLARGVTKLLRHQAVKLGLDVRPDGFVKVSELLGLRQFKGATLENLENCVRNCRKQRMALRKFNGEWYMRANQGHSIKGIDASAIFDPINSPDELPNCIHGTYKKFWPAIQKHGLSKMRRQHIHFTPSEVTTKDARSGFRSSCNVLIYLDVEKAMGAGLKLYRSENNVILSPGFSGGLIPPSFFKCVVDRHSGKPLLFQKLEAPAKERDAVKSSSADSPTENRLQEDIDSLNVVDKCEIVQVDDHSKVEDKSEAAAADGIEDADASGKLELKPESADCAEPMHIDQNADMPP